MTAPKPTTAPLHSAPELVVSEYVKHWRDILFRTLTFGAGMFLVQGGWMAVGGIELSVTKEDDFMIRTRSWAYVIVVPIVWMIFATTVQSIMNALERFPQRGQKVNRNAIEKITLVSRSYVMKRVWIISIAGALMGAYTGFDNIMWRTLFNVSPEDVGDRAIAQSAINVIETSPDKTKMLDRSTAETKWADGARTLAVMVGLCTGIVGVALVTYHLQEIRKAIHKDDRRHRK